MSSSSSALLRSRSTRKPSGKTETPVQNAAPHRTTSPSRLPVKGAVAAAANNGPERPLTRTASAAAKPTTSRPLSGVFNRLRSATSTTPEPSVSSSRPPRTATTRSATTTSTTRPASASGPSTSSSRPTTSSGAAPPRQRIPSSHSRTKSSITTLSSATTLRPPSSGSSSSTSTQQITATDRSKPPITRSGAQHTRQISAPVTAPPRKTSREIPSVKPTSRELPTHKPAFTTLQQHYSPAKNLAPKPLTSTYLVPPSPSKLPANVAISAETARLQTELLQLHLMHRDVEAVTRQWRGSAKEKLGGRFAALVETGEETGRLEAGAVERGNVQALAEWGGRGLEGRVQVLDEAVSGVWGLGEQGGRYAQLVRRFERWVGRVEEVGLLRAAGDLGKLVGEDGEVVMVGGMDGAWREECERIGRRLEEWNRQLKGLEGDVDGGSSLARILKGTRELVRDMLAELEVMRELEREVVAEEMRWVKAVSREMDDQTSSPQVKRAGAIWRAF